MPCLVWEDHGIVNEWHSLTPATATGGVYDPKLFRLVEVSPGIKCGVPPDRHRYSDLNVFALLQMAVVDEGVFLAGQLGEEGKGAKAAAVGVPLDI